MNSKSEKNNHHAARTVNSSRTCMTGKLRRPLVIDKLAKLHEVNLRDSSRSSRLIPFTPSPLPFRGGIRGKTRPAHASQLVWHERARRLGSAAVVGGFSRVNYNVMSYSSQLVSAHHRERKRGGGTKKDLSRQLRVFAFTVTL